MQKQHDILIGIRFVGSSSQSAYDGLWHAIKRLYNDVRGGDNLLGGYEDEILIWILINSVYIFGHQINKKQLKGWYGIGDTKKIPYSSKAYALNYILIWYYRSCKCIWWWCISKDSNSRWDLIGIRELICWQLLLCH